MGSFGKIKIKFEILVLSPQNLNIYRELLLRNFDWVFVVHVYPMIGCFFQLGISKFPQKLSSVKLIISFTWSGEEKCNTCTN